MSVKQVLKQCYTAIPFKHAVFKCLRPALRNRPNIYQHLHFKGAIEVRISPDRSFKMVHHGYQVENDLFWSGFGGGWEATSLRLWARVVSLSTCIFDVGANTGVFAISAKTINPSARVVAFEPIERIYDRLRENIELNRYDITAENLAASDKTAKVLIHDSVGEHSYSASLQSSGWEANLIAKEIQAVRLDDYIEETGVGPDLLKIDVELHEPPVFRGMERLLSTARPTVLVEILNDEVAKEIDHAIVGMDYQIYRVVEGKGLVQASSTALIPGVDARNVLLCSSGFAARANLSELTADGIFRLPCGRCQL